MENNFNDPDIYVITPGFKSLDIPNGSRELFIRNIRGVEGRKSVRDFKETL